MPATGTPVRLNTQTANPWQDGAGVNLTCEQVRLTPIFLPDYDPDDDTRFYRIPQGTPLVEVIGDPNTFTPPLSQAQQQENCDAPLTKPHATLILAYCVEVNTDGVIRECACCQCVECGKDEACGFSTGDWRVQDLNRQFMSPTTFHPDKYIRGDWQNGLVRL